MQNKRGHLKKQTKKESSKKNKSTKKTCIIQEKKSKPLELEIFEENNKIGIKGKGKDKGKIFVEPIYDYDDAIKGSYYIVPEWADNYYLYRFRDGYAIFKMGEKVCVYNDRAELVEPLTPNVDKIVDKYYWNLKKYWKHSSL